MIFIVEKARAITADQIGSTFANYSPTVFYPTVSSLLTVIIAWILYFAGILAFVFLVYSGILYVTSGGNTEQQKRAQQGLISAIFGIIIITLAYTILRAVSNTAAVGTL